MKIIDEELIGKVRDEAKKSPRLRMNYNFHQSLDDKVLETCIVCQEGGTFGVDIPKNTWHDVECLEPSVLFECKEGPFIEHEVDGILTIPARE